jgi:glycosyltransferase involved in cell wall biosynthesis
VEDKLKQGEALFAEGKIEEAEKCFLQILEQDFENKEAYNNLGVIEYTRKNIEPAFEYFSQALKIDPFYKDTIFNYIILLRDLNRFHESVPILEKVLNKFPDDHEISQLLNKACLARSSNTKIAVLCLPGLQSFLGDIVDYLKTRYYVQTCYSNNNQDIESAVQWADIVWLEWANELAAHVTNNIRHLEKKLVVCRVHRYEVFSPFFSKIRWGLVNTTIFVSKFMSTLSQRLVPDLDKKTNIRILYNGVNLKKFKFRENAPGFNLAVVGYIHLRKNPSFWPHLLSKLVEIDKRYTLHIAGEYQQAECKLYLEHIINSLGIEDNIKFYGHQDNIQNWLEDKNYLLSTSIHESFGYSIAEAMAMGIKPLIHRFPGSEELWPHNCLYSSTDEVIEMIREKDNYDSLEYYEFVEKRYSLKSQMEKIGRIMDGMLNRIYGEVSSSTLSYETPVQSQQHMGILTSLTD